MARYKTDWLLNPSWAQIPTDPNLSRRDWACAWFYAVAIAWIKGVVVFTAFGILPYVWFDIQLTWSTFFWLDVVVWVFLGGWMNHLFLEKIPYHIFVDLESLAAIKSKALFGWLWFYFNLSLTFWKLAVF